MESPVPNSETVTAVETARESLSDEAIDWNVMFGFDGYIDRVREVVAQRENPSSYTRMDDIKSLGSQILEAADAERSILLEWAQTGTRTGGHVCHLSRATGRLGFEPVMVGMFGNPVRDQFRHEFEDYEMVSLGEPGVTDAIEFADGKVMLTESGGMHSLDWDGLCDELGLEQLAALTDGTDALGLGYWGEIPGMESIFDGLRTELLPRLRDPPEHILLDPADISDRDHDQIRSGIASLRRLDDVVPVTVSANRFETAVLAKIVDSEDENRSLTELALTAHDGIGVTRFVTHSVEASVVVNDDGVGRALVPQIDNPVLTTSAGDHFNVGLLLGLLEGTDEAATAVLGNAVAGMFVRTGESPTMDALQSFLDRYIQEFE